MAWEGALSVNHTETYKQIVETTYTLFAEHGIDKTSMAMIAKEVGITKPAVYYYFSSKEELVDFLFAEICKEIDFAKCFALEKYTKDNFQTKLLSDGYKMIQDQENDAFFSRVINEYILISTRNEKYRQTFYSITEGFMNGFVDLLTKGAELGLVADEKLATKAQLLSMVIDNIGNYMLMGFKINYNEIWAEAVNNVLKK
ncbi:TetR/AcrR family transcriptional regulator [Paenibacillus apiarius]|nr:TetR/AcrR family transcriptional regulator [Paenibacillus apiarius]